MIYDGSRLLHYRTATGPSGFLRWTSAPPSYAFRDCPGISDAAR
jgi:hypothetical protein